MVKNRLKFILAVLSFILTWTVATTPILAAGSCNPWALSIDVPCIPPRTYRCSWTDGQGSNKSTCCNDAASCIAAKQDLAKQGEIFYPTGACGEGAIDTALGCIPYTAPEFTPALIKFLIGVVGAISLVVMLVATIQIMTGGGNPEQVKKGKELFTGAIMGILFIIFSVTLLRLIAADIIKLEGFI